MNRADGGLPQLPTGTTYSDYDGVMGDQWITADFWTYDLVKHTLLLPVSKLGHVWAKENLKYRRARYRRLPRLRNVASWSVGTADECGVIDLAGGGDVTTFGNVIVLGRKSSVEMITRIQDAGLMALQQN